MSVPEHKVRYVDSGSALDRMTTELRTYDVVSIDTEFIRERTYYPRLCLIQIAAGEKIWCVDPLGIEDISGLFALLFEASRVKIFHAARQDLEIVFNLTGSIPPALFDTQIAAALLGRPDQIAYAGLVAEFYTIDLDKSSSRTDWAQRPLSDRQLDYAADDVRYLEGIKRQLEVELRARGREDWLTEECARLESLKLYANDPGDAWLRIKGINKLDAPTLAIVNRLASWRETCAQARDLPRGWVLKDDRLVALARAAPGTKSMLGSVEGLSPGLVRRHADELLTIINESEAFGQPLKPLLVPQFTKEGKALIADLQRLLQDCAFENEVSQSLIATRREIELAVAGERDLRVFEGWRQNLFGQTAIDAIESSAHVTLYA